MDHIISQFDVCFHESNLLDVSDLVVASPVEDYFLHIDDLPEARKVKNEITECFALILCSVCKDCIYLSLYMLLAERS